MSPAPLILLADVSAQKLERSCGTEPHWACEGVLNATGSEVLADLSEWGVTVLPRILLIVLGAFILTRVARRGIRIGLRRIAERGRRDRLKLTPAALRDTGELPAERAAQRLDALATVLRSGASFVIWVIAGFMILAELGVSLAPLLAGAGVVGIALGFGAQSLVRDFLAGIFILIEDQYAVGDIVDLGQGSGTENGVVENVSLRTTRLRAVDGTVWHIPNGEVRAVGNMSQHWSRSLLDIEVAYDTDLERASKVIKRVADGVWKDDGHVLEEPEVWGVESLGASGIAIRLVVKTTPSEQWRISRALRERIKAAFDEEGIEIPFPQQTVWMRPDAPSRARGGEEPPPAGGEGS